MVAVQWVQELPSTAQAQVKAQLALMENLPMLAPGSGATGGLFTQFRFVIQHEDNNKY